ncbi:propanol-preferring alcohol dehydrogenase [Paralcaligenes ureilyticus]|uniref:alcohol dehydrogenase n=2 Tax=Paralcaligenes ureilyticus TaxID=627131 RepID=A0A4R3MA83_9BURK|nr:propanol-preferring alcohol dehydrogenase [Paralcaligenes ureilyticus]
MHDLTSTTMRAMVLHRLGDELQIEQLPRPVPGINQVQIQVEACGVCRTDVHLVDGELPNPALPIIPGHEIIGRISALGPGVKGLTVNQRVGVPWLGWACGKCDFCSSGQENLCDSARFTGYQINGGYAEYTVADARYCFVLADESPNTPSAMELAPLMCAGLIGYRALRFAGEAKRIGLYGFGAAAHIVAQVLRSQGRVFYAFTRPGDTKSQQFALHFGAAWAGGSDKPAPVALDAALLFASAGPLVPLALRQVKKGGCVICAGIHMSDIPTFPYADLWGERTIRSVANLTREDGLEFLNLAQKIHIRTKITIFSLEKANEALASLRSGGLQGAAVLAIRPTDSDWHQSA